MGSGWATVSQLESDCFRWMGVACGRHTLNTNRVDMPDGDVAHLHMYNNGGAGDITSVPQGWWNECAVYSRSGEGVSLVHQFRAEPRIETAKSCCTGNVPVLTDCRL